MLMALSKSPFLIESPKDLKIWGRFDKYLSVLPTTGRVSTVKRNSLPSIADFRNLKIRPVLSEEDVPFDTWCKMSGIAPSI